ncbi:MAG: YraN family protein [Bacteroidia bacterium]|nr:YraN family protein [Bacteroidia bacterium]NNC85015.1 YraN family protein [Bacteroidia bacterium]
MAEHNKLGIKGEKLALQFLLENNYKVLEQNWRYKRAEVDIIAKKDNWIIIVEVKTRSTELFAEPGDSITNNKMKMLTNAAQAYILEHDLENEVRFDVIYIISSGSSTKINHIENAFYPFASEMDD